MRHKRKDDIPFENADKRELRLNNEHVVRTTEVKHVERNFILLTDLLRDGISPGLSGPSTLPGGLGLPTQVTSMDKLSRKHFISQLLGATPLLEAQSPFPIKRQKFSQHLRLFTGNFSMLTRS